jgi:hypothetical protein
MSKPSLEPPSRNSSPPPRMHRRVRIFTGLATWSSDSSTRLSTVGAWQPATTSSRPTTSHSSNLHPYGCGCASPRPSPLCLLRKADICAFMVHALLYRGGLVSSTFRLLGRSWFRCHSQGPRFSSGSAPRVQVVRRKRLAPHESDIAAPLWQIRSLDPANASTAWTTWRSATPTTSSRSRGIRVRRHPTLKSGRYRAVSAAIGTTASLNRIFC